MARNVSKGLQSLTLVTQLGINIAGPPVLGVLFGQWLDGKFDTGSRWAMILLFVGILTGISSAWKTIRAEIQNNKNDDRR